jgi:hypothetical protein
MRHARRKQPIATATQNERGEKGAMRITGLAAFVGISALSLLLHSAPASAQADCKALVPPSPFGPDDQTGATNRITAAVTKAAAAEIQTGNVISMSNVLVDGVPLYGTRFSRTILTTFPLTPGAAFGKNQLTGMEDTWLSESHVGTHIDGLGHIGVQDCYYNQTPIAKYVGQNYLKRLGIENIKTFATRGVLIDMVKVFQAAGKLKSNPACRTPCLDGGTVITEADLQAGLKAENVTLREGDGCSCTPAGWTCSCSGPRRMRPITRANPASASLRLIGSSRKSWSPLAPTPPGSR